MEPERTPTRLKLLGVSMVVFGVLNVASPLVESYGLTSGDVAWQLGTGFVIGAFGLGLAFDGRWAWGGALVVGLVAIFLGILEMTGPGDIANPGAAYAGALVVLLGALMLGVLLSPGSLRWLRATKDLRRSSERT